MGFDKYAPKPGFEPLVPEPDPLVPELPVLPVISPLGGEGMDGGLLGRLMFKPLAQVTTSTTVIIIATRNSREGFRMVITLRGFANAIDQLCC